LQFRALVVVKNAVCFGTPSDKKFLTIAPGCYRVAVAGSNDTYDTIRDAILMFAQKLT